MKIFGREPAVIIQTVTAVLAVLVGFGLPGLSDTLAAGVTSVLVALLAAWQALAVQPVAPTALSGLIVAAAPLAAHFGLHATQAQVGLLTAAVAAVLGLVVRAQSEPITSPVPPGNASVAPRV